MRSFHATPREALNFGTVCWRGDAVRITVRPIPSTAARPEGKARSITGSRRQLLAKSRNAGSEAESMASLAVRRPHRPSVSAIAARRLRAVGCSAKRTHAAAAIAAITHQRMS